MLGIIRYPQTLFGGIMIYGRKVNIEGLYYMEKTLERLNIPTTVLQGE